MGVRLLGRLSDCVASTQRATLNSIFACRESARIQPKMNGNQYLIMRSYLLKVAKEANLLNSFQPRTDCLPL